MNAVAVSIPPTHCAMLVLIRGSAPRSLQPIKGRDRETMRQLARHGYVRAPVPGVYELTQKGICAAELAKAAYLDANASAA